MSNEMTREEMLSMIAKLGAENAALKQRRAPAMTMKVSEKGAVSVYGQGKWPVTLYRSQWERLLAAKDEILAFIEANADSLAVKG